MHVSSTRPAGRRVLFMATCLCDAFYDDAARASVEVLEYLGCEVIFPGGQTCCGQPAFNGGDWKSSRRVVRHCAKVFAGDLPVIVPSGSCAAMILHGAGLAFENEPDREAIADLAGRTWEVMDFIVNGLGIESWPGAYPKRVAFHRSCHTRGTDSGPSAVQLLESIDGLDLVPFGESEQCCGFGGTFSVSFPNVSEAMGDLKLDHILEVGPEVLAAVDMGCVLHLAGLAQRKNRLIPMMHAAQILKDAVVGDTGVWPERRELASL
ncbi:MAG: (Fe-S)-binding protein [Verrucomicrobia bacterium]|nr:MAG: (Fe-S)-binding protein [Verrucomicrobiota bacterium]